MTHSPRTFDSTRDAFDFCCDSMNYKIRTGATLPAVVQDAREQFGTPTPVKRRESGHQLAILNVPTEDGILQVIGETITADAPELQAGDFVEWRCGTITPGVCVGLILGRLAPELLGDESWRMAEPFPVEVPGTDHRQG